MTNEAVAAARELVAYSRRLLPTGLQTGSGGNVSFRLPGARHFFIKSSGSSLSEMEAEDLIEVDEDGSPLGPGEPSVERFTHAAIYRLLPGVLSIVHAHAPWSIACAHGRKAIPPSTYHVEKKMGPIPVLDIDGMSNQNVVDAVEHLLSSLPALKGFVQARHGLFAFGARIPDAFFTAELIEETAKVSLLIAIQGGA
jgi:ribulose-5-phosphate 4-epimerase/fuculose-1-phosphate aldolase